MNHFIRGAGPLLRSNVCQYRYKNHQLSRFCSFRFFTSTNLGEESAVSIIENEDMISKIPLEDIRNFCFIAHVDHGKSSLSSRILELTGNLGAEAQNFARAAAASRCESAKQQQQQLSQSHSSSSQSRETQKEQFQLLDTLSVEQDRGITVKASAATMLYSHPSAVGPTGLLLLNMIDTPGHVDFGREVQRSLSFVQGAVLLLDAAQGIQAQTWTVHEKVKSMKNPPELLIALTKVDLEAAKPIHVALTVSEWLSWDDPDSIIITSARNRVGIVDVLNAICSNVPPPKALEDDDGSTLRAQVVDSWYDSRGVNCLVQIVSGELTEGDRISIVADNNSKSQSFPVQEVGMVLPHQTRTGQLRRGQMGFVRFGLRDPRQATPGTILISNKDVGKKMILPDIRAETSTKSVLYASVHPADSGGFEDLCNAVDRLALNDMGLEVTRTSSVGASEGGGPFLGPGLKVGFQGLLHVEVFRQRLFDEFEVEAIVAPPKVPYEVTFLPDKHRKTEEYVKVIEDLSEWPESGTRFRVKEPVVNVRIMAPANCAGPVMDLISRKRGMNQESRPMDEEIWLFTATVPWAEVVIDFHDQLKNVTTGYGSLDTSEADPPFVESDLSKVDVMLNGDIVEPLAFVCHKNSAQAEARIVCKKLQEVLPRQQFVTIIQAKAQGKIIASARIKAYRKDVLVKSGKRMGGGDITRKKKLLEKQKQGKKMQQESGKVTLSQAAFNSVISRSS